MATCPQGNADAQEQAALGEAKEGYKIQMQYQGKYADEAKDLRRQYEQEKAQIEKRYEAANSSAPQDLLQLAATSPQGNANAQEQAALRGAKDGYKIQMQYQGQYADEAKDLKREYEQEKAQIEKRYQAANSSSPQDLLQLMATSPQGNANAEEQAALREAKEGYKIQMQYQ